MKGLKIEGATFRSDLAACAGLDPDLFHPDRGASTAEAKCQRIADRRKYLRVVS